MKTFQDDSYWINRSLQDKKMDWEQTAGTWLDGYVESKNHPHRSLIVNALQSFLPIESILEIGCNSAPNLNLIREKVSIQDNVLFGIDVNADAIEKAKSLLPAANFVVGNVKSIPFPDKSFDIVIADAVLIYIDSNAIGKAMHEIERVVKRGIILIEWFDKLIEGTIKDFHWARNYTKILKKVGFEVEEIKITKDLWNSKNWIKNGRLFIAHRA